jgi:hypothetical protein
MTVEEIRTELENGSEIRDYELRNAEFARRFAGVDEGTLFRALFPIAVKSQNAGPASDAGCVLWYMKPRCPIGCGEAIQMMLKDWDVSLEEPVFYLAEQFGTAAVRGMIDELKGKVSEKGELSTLATIEYWVKCFEEMRKG